MIKIITVSASILIFLLVIELVRQEKLTFKYASWWICVSSIAILLTIFDQIIFKMARFFGFELASNFIFFTILTIFVFMGLFMTILLSQQNSHNDAMAQKIAMLEFEVEQLKNKKDES